MNPKALTTLAALTAAACLSTATYAAINFEGQFTGFSTGTTGLTETDFAGTVIYGNGPGAQGLQLDGNTQADSANTRVDASTPFTFSIDPASGSASMSYGGNVLNNPDFLDVGQFPGVVRLVLKARNDTGVDIDNLMINGVAFSDTGLEDYSDFDTLNSYIFTTDADDFAGGLTITGDLIHTQNGSTTSQNPALQIDVNSIPEPSSLALVTAVGLAALRRRR
ncbi:MAG: PEP-CTERM sorting domain-containing protein [Planctomycetota bacterium]